MCLTIATVCATKWALSTFVQRDNIKIHLTAGLDVSNMTALWPCRNGKQQKQAKVRRTKCSFCHQSILAPSKGDRNFMEHWMPPTDSYCCGVRFTVNGITRLNALPPASGEETICHQHMLHFHVTHISSFPLILPVLLQAFYCW